MRFSDATFFGAFGQPPAGCKPEGDVKAPDGTALGPACSVNTPGGGKYYLADGRQIAPVYTRDKYGNTLLTGWQVIAAAPSSGATWIEQYTAGPPVTVTLPVPAPVPLPPPATTPIAPAAPKALPPPPKTGLAIAAAGAGGGFLVGGPVGAVVGGVGGYLLGRRK